MDRPKFICCNTMIPLSWISEWIKEDHRYVNRIEEPVVMMVVADFPSTLEYFKPTNAVAEAAIRANPKNIGRIKKPTKELQIIAVSLNPEIFWMIKNPCNEAKSIAALMS